MAHLNKVILFFVVVLQLFQNNLHAQGENEMPCEALALLDEAAEGCIGADLCFEEEDHVSGLEQLEQATESLQMAMSLAPELTEGELLFHLDRAVKHQRPGRYPDLDSNPYVSKKAKKAVRPWLLPNSHPMKATLDAIFSSGRVTLTDETLQQAGFTILFSQPRSFVRVVSHPALPGYLLKLYPDSELRLKREREDWYWFSMRCQGARQIAKILSKKKIKRFVVAKKWIYPLPSDPSPPNSPQFRRKNFVLLVEDMQLVSKTENRTAWKTLVTRNHLKEFHAIITAAKGSSYRASNVAYTRNGKFAFIDTEYPREKPNYDAIKPYLSHEMTVEWNKIIKSKGKRK